MGLHVRRTLHSDSCWRPCPDLSFPSVKSPADDPEITTGEGWRNHTCKADETKQVPHAGWLASPEIMIASGCQWLKWCWARTCKSSARSMVETDHLARWRSVKCTNSVILSLPLKDPWGSVRDSLLSTESIMRHRRTACTMHGERWVTNPYFVLFVRQCYS